MFRLRGMKTEGDECKVRTLECHLAAHRLRLTLFGKHPLRSTNDRAAVPENVPMLVHRMAVPR
jgi:hypothetical protein